MAMTEDISPFFSLDEFATTVTFSGLPSVAGIFEKNYVRSVGGIGVENSAIALFLPNANVPVSVIDRVVAIDGNNYVVADKAPDDMPGVTALFLEVQ